MSTLQSAFDQMVERTPRRSLNRFPGPLLAEWSALLKVAEHQYHTAFAGNDCRHKENNNDIPEQSCSNGQGEMVRGETVNLADMRAACPDAMELAIGVRTEGDMIREAARLRGEYGTHRTAWEEACDDLGRPRAAVLIFYLLQLYVDDQTGRRTINNFGGLFRSWARKVAAGEVDLAKEIHVMRRKRAH
jgi:replication initiation protein RepC